MKKSTNGTKDNTGDGPARLIDERIAELGDWRGATLARMRKLKSAFPGGHVGALFFTTEPVDSGVLAYSRMFAPAQGIIEDPATGSASGPVGCYLVSHGLVPRNRADGIVSLQGVAMGRPSYIHIAIASDDRGAITRVQVGGRSVLIAEATLWC